MTGESFGKNLLYPQNTKCNSIITLKTHNTKILFSMLNVSLGISQKSATFHLKMHDVVAFQPCIDRVKQYSARCVVATQ